MASPHSFISTVSSSLPDLYAPPPSHDTSMQQVSMPNVFVIPPEEEQDETPPWCEFDAAEAAQEAHSTKPDIEAIDTALNLQQQVDNRAPAFHRALQNDSQDTVVLPKKGSLAQLKENVAYWDERTLHRRPYEGDRDIVEVFKVRRDEGMDECGKAQMQMKRSKTLRLRATQAFRSIKNVGKGARRPEASASSSSLASQVDSRGSMDYSEAGSLPSPGASQLKKRKSIAFSQFFTFSQHSRPVAAYPDVLRSPISPTSPSSAALPRYSTSTMPPLISPITSNARGLQSSPSLEDCVDASSDSPQLGPPLPRGKSFRKRISVLDLQRLFSSNSPPRSPALSSPPPSSPPPSSPSPTTESSRDPSSPVTTAHNFGASPSASEPHSLAESEASRTSSLSSFAFISNSSSPSPSNPELGIEQDKQSDCDGLEVEMQLNSLHFDSLEFNPGEFL
ncbi:hypothetical protein WOLCODRAFT_136226 [Wolfiporia cocos MD-104 SS10]|uniref:Uncharacterized protein n=1 Tax=Wolfiporia cocos (strain MD-104) TaxID=742152 RepID=A0A2H3J7X5_WOLCO|nr:hypothetical protein WOLCODRAFT_136226 [Wolfiporia cocos MD-104 SS10]